MGDRFKVELIIAGIYESILSAPMELDWYYKVEGMDSSRDERMIVYIEKIITERGWNISHLDSIWEDESDNGYTTKSGIIFRVRPK